MVLIITFVMSGAAKEGQPLYASKTDQHTFSSVIDSTLARDQIHNESGSAPSVTHSLIEWGLSEGTLDNGANVFASPLFADDDGLDNIPGSVDDDVRLQGASPAVNSGSNSLLPNDKFDLDGDGDTDEPIPSDIAGADRTYDSGGVGIVDIGAHESSATGVSNVADEQMPRILELGAPYPNPVRDSGTVEFSMTSSEVAEIAIYDALGRKKTVLFDEVAQAGRQYVIEIDARDFSSGVYFLRLKSSSFQTSKQFVVVR